MKSEKKRVFVLIDNATRLEFFLRRVRNHHDTDFVFLHCSLYSYVRAKFIKFASITHILLRRKKEISALNCIENYLMHYHIPNEVDFKELSFGEDHMVWIFNGFQSVAKQLIQTSNLRNIMYFEIGNFPNKYQKNHHGINADASLNLPKSSAKIDQNLFFELKKFSPSHAKRGPHDVIVEYAINYAGSTLFRTANPKIKLINAITHAVNLYRARNIISTYKKIAVPDNSHMFVGQVEYDSQIIFQSTETNLSALKKWHAEHSNLSNKCVYRFHPAEKCVYSVRSIEAYCTANGIMISNYGTIMEAMASAQTIATINSTSGLYALLLDKPVRCYGRSVYKNWSKDEAQSYIINVLKEDNF